VPVADLGDRGHVDGVVEAAVPAPAQPEDLALSRRHLDRGGAVAGGEVVPAREPGHVADIADDDAGHDHPHFHLHTGGQKPDLTDPALSAWGLDRSCLLTSLTR
jgi:hypothetical protein